MGPYLGEVSKEVPEGTGLHWHLRVQTLMLHEPFKFSLAVDQIRFVTEDDCVTV